MMGKKILYQAALPICLLLCYWEIPALRDFLHTSLGFLRAYNFDGLRLYILSFGSFAPLVSILIITVQSTVPFFPGVVMTLTNAWLFGWLPGSFYTAIGACAGAALDFFLVRWYGQKIFFWLAGAKRAARLDVFVASHGAAAIFLMRLIPVIPYKIVSCCAGLSSMRLRVFLTASAAGQMPAILLYSYLGESLLQNAYWMLLVTAVCFIALIFFWNKNKIGAQWR